jgi:hypothetical protein
MPMNRAGSILFSPVPIRVNASVLAGHYIQLLYSRWTSRRCHVRRSQSSGAGRRCATSAASAHWGVIEIRAHADGEHRVIVVARFAEAVYVLHAFMKASRKTSLLDLDLARRRWRDLLMERARDE